VSRYWETHGGSEARLRAGPFGSRMDLRLLQARGTEFGQALQVTSDPSSRVLLLAPMRSELRPVIRLLALKRSDSKGEPFYAGHRDGTDILATTIGVGPEAAARATDEILSRVPVDHVIVCGIAGAVRSDQQIGSLIVPQVVIDGTTRTRFEPDAFRGVVRKGTVLTVGELVLDKDRLDRLEADGVEALDMESAAVGEVCLAHGVTWTVFRAISDRARDGAVDDSVLGLLNEDGTTNVRAAVRLVLRHPMRVPGLVRLALDSVNAARAAARAAVAAISG